MSVNSLGMPVFPRHWPLPLRVLSAHLAAMPGAIIALRFFSLLGFEVGFFYLAVCEGLIAAVASPALGLPRWWLWINLLFFPMLWLFAQTDIEPAWYLAGFLLLALTSFGTLATRVPLFLSSNAAVREVARRIPENSDTSVLDLGCGLGGLLAGLAKSRPTARLHGVDAAPLPWLFSRLRLAGRADIRFGSLWREDLSRHDIVYAYLSPAPMARLWAKARHEMRSGSLFISNSFAVPEVPPDEIVELHDLSRARLLIWRMP